MQVADRWLPTIAIGVPTPRCPLCLCVFSYCLLCAVYAAKIGGSGTSFDTSGLVFDPYCLRDEDEDEQEGAEGTKSLALPARPVCDGDGRCQRAIADADPRRMKGPMPGRTLPSHRGCSVKPLLVRSRTLPFLGPNQIVE